MGSKARTRTRTSRRQPEKKQADRPPQEEEEALGRIEDASVPVEVQQALLDIFQDSFPTRPGRDESTNIQTVKRHLYSRAFEAAFGSEELREAYALRWSPSRALAYMDLLCGVPDLAATLTAAAEDPADKDRGEEKAPPTKVSCLGAGAGAEVVALAASVRHLLLLLRGRAGAADQAGKERGPAAGLAVTAVDVADWTSVVDRLGGRLRGSSLAPPGGIDVAFRQRDLLLPVPAEAGAEAEALLAPDTRLVTLLFTLNELYGASVPATTSFLLGLTCRAAPGTLLLVVDSPGSYSTVTLGGAPGGAERRYPMRWLLDHTLLEASRVGGRGGGGGGGGGDDGGRQWEKVLERESRWFRLPRGLRYVLDLEDMRYQVHLYRRL